MVLNHDVLYLKFDLYIVTDMKSKVNAWQQIRNVHMKRDVMNSAIDIVNTKLNLQMQSIQIGKQAQNQAIIHTYIHTQPRTFSLFLKKRAQKILRLILLLLQKKWSTTNRNKNKAMSWQAAVY